MDNILRKDRESYEASLFYEQFIQIEEAEEEELGAMFPQRNKLPLMNLAKQVRIASFHLTSSFHHCQQQQQSKELSLGEDDIETLENEGVDDEAGDNDEVRSRQDGG